MFFYSIIFKFKIIETYKQYIIFNEFKNIIKNNIFNINTISKRYKIFNFEQNIYFIF